MALARRKRTERMMVKGEELVSLLCGANEWYTQTAMDSAVIGSGPIRWPEQIARVEALVLPNRKRHLNAVLTLGAEGLVH